MLVHLPYTPPDR